MDGKGGQRNRAVDLATTARSNCADSFTSRRNARHPWIVRRGASSAMTWSHECFAEPFIDDQGMDPAEIESRLFWLLFREHRMPSTQKLRIIDAHGPSLGSAENHSKPALGVRIWARVLAALHESREQEAARVIRRHRDLIQNFQAIELPGRGMEPKTHA